MMTAVEDERTSLTRNASGVPESSVILTTRQLQPTPHPKTGLVHCMLERSTHRSLLGLGSSNKVMTLRLEEDSTILLQAQAVDAHRFTISSPDIGDSINSPQTLATLIRLQSNMSCITYGLRRHSDDALMAAIVYTVPSVATFLSSPPPRRAQMAIFHMNDDSRESSKSDPEPLEAILRDTIKKHGSLDALQGSVLVPGVTVLSSLEPYVKSNGQVGLNFRGRGRETSPKNMQLVTATTSGGANSNNKPPTVHAQMVKWEMDMYHLDYYCGAVPSSCSDKGVMNALTTFAFGIAQLDL